MIVVAIVAILAAVALPAYRDYILRGQISDAHNQLSSLSARMEQFYQDNRQYESTATAGTCGVPAPTGDALRYFTFACVTGTGAPGNQVFTWTANGIGGTTGFAFTMNQTRTKTSAAPAGSGWNASTSCWITRKGETC